MRPETMGHVVNGQHRLAAISQVDWDKVENEPLFLIVWGVAPESLLLDSLQAHRQGPHSVAPKVLSAKAARAAYAASAA